jgi:hypothetical protein
MKEIGPLTIKFYEKLVRRYKTIFNWLCIKSSCKEEFWIRLKKEYDEDKGDCFELRL